MQGYALRYYKTYDLNGHEVKLEIHKKYLAVEYAPAPKEIGRVLQGLSLDVQGEQDDIISPIVKTSLSMMFADSPGLEQGKKTGDWEEFYTPDSTGYKILLYLDNILYWSGYVTPDSFEEDLEYRGSVTIIARDNIGHLQDFQFDAAGNAEKMISVRDLINSAWNKVSCLLSLTYAEGEDVVWPKCGDYTALNCVVNVEAFEGKSWFDALEAVLDSLGLVLRFVGKNKAIVMPLRMLPCLDKERLSLVEVRPTLLQATAHRMLTPACKSIVDNFNYEKGAIAETKLNKNDYNRVDLNINGNSVGTWELTESSGWLRYGEIGTINPFEFKDDPRSDASSAMESSIFLSVVKNVNSNNCIILGRTFSAGEQTLDIKFSLNSIFYTAEYDSAYVRGFSSQVQKISLNYSIQAYICDEQNHVCKLLYFDAQSNSFVEEEKYCVATISKGFAEESERNAQSTIDIEHSIVIPENTGSLQVYLYGFTAEVSDGVRPGTGNGPYIQRLIDTGIAYCRINNFTIEQSEADSYKYSKVTSIYDESYNMMLTREPVLGVGPLVLSPKVIRNGIYVPDGFYSPASRWKWPNGSNTSLQALIAQQMLMYYSQPNSIITGTLLALAEKNEILDFNCLWRWRDHKLALVSGQLDLMTGFIESAKLREFEDWENLWPEEGLLITEDSSYVVTDSNMTIKIGK